MALFSFGQNLNANLNNSVKEIMNNARNNISSIIGNAKDNFKSLWSGGFAGISESGIEELKKALNNYVVTLESQINEVDASVNFSDSLSGDVREASYEYVDSVKMLLRAYVTTMRINISDADTALKYYISNSNQLATNIMMDANDIRAAAQKISLDGENGIPLTLSSSAAVGVAGTIGTGNLSSKINSITNNFQENALNFFNTISSGLESSAATIGVATTSILSGAGRVLEKIGDGAVIAAGGIASGITWLADKVFGTNNASKVMDNALDFARRDLVSEANDKFYQDTKLGQYINDTSYMKYDSKTAQGIQKVAETATKIAAATAATVLTGGTAAPLVLGAMYGMGQSGELYTNSVNREGGESYNYAKAGLKIGLGGAAGAAEFYAYGKMGNGLVDGYKALTESGTTIGEIVSSSGGIDAVLKSIQIVDKKELAMNALKQTVSKESLLEIGLTTSDHIVNFAFGDETLAEFAKNTASEAALGTVMNFGGSFMGGLAQESIVPILDNAASSQAFAKYDSFMRQVEAMDGNSYDNELTHNLMNNDLDSYNSYVNRRFSDANVVDDMAERLYNATGGSANKDQITDALSGKTTFVRTDDYFDAHDVMGYNDATGSHIKTDGYTPKEIEGTMIHEATHAISRIDDYNTGLEINEGTRGINESITQYYTQLACPGDQSGYDEGTAIIKRLLDDGVVSKSTLDNAYFNTHSTSDIMREINSNLTTEGKIKLMESGFNPRTGTAWNDITSTNDVQLERGKNIMNDALNIIELYRK